MAIGASKGVVHDVKWEMTDKVAERKHNQAIEAKAIEHTSKLVNRKQVFVFENRVLDRGLNKEGK